VRQAPAFPSFRLGFRQSSLSEFLQPQHHPVLTVCAGAVTVFPAGTRPAAGDPESHPAGDCAMNSRKTFGSTHPEGSHREMLPPAEHDISEATAGENHIPDAHNNPPEAHTEVDSEADLGDPMGN
jgi:hypothetical protein